MVVGKFGHIWAKVGGSGWRLTDRAGMGDISRGLCVCARRSRGGCGWVWASLAIYGQGWAKIGRS